MSQQIMFETDRRSFVGGAALLALLTGLPLSLISCGKVAEKTTARQRNMIRDVCQLVIPRTETPGAGELAVGDFVILALSHGLENARQPLAREADSHLLAFRRSDGSLDQLRWLEAELDKSVKGDFMKLDLHGRMAALASLDTQAYAKDARDQPWRTVKALILTGYYTSETGGAQELRYEHVPGRWDPDVPLKPGDRAWSSDWAGVEFG